MSMTPEQFVDHLEGVPDRMVAFMSKVMGEEARRAEKKIKGAFRPYPTANRFMGQFNSRSGNLERSVGATLPVQNASSVSLMLGLINDTERMTMIAEVQDYGATITPKRRSKLAIPAGEGLNPDGTRKYESIFDADDDYSFIKFTDDKIFGIEDGLVELIATRKRSHKIKDSAFISGPASEAIERIEDRLYDDKDLDEVF